MRKAVWVLYAILAAITIYLGFSIDALRRESRANNQRIQAEQRRHHQAMTVRIAKLKADMERSRALLKRLDEAQDKQDDR